MDIDKNALDLAQLACQPTLYHKDAWRQQNLTLSLLQGSICTVDPLFNGIQVIVSLEVIEHLESDTLSCFEKHVFGVYRPEMGKQ